jgi:uncharacterized protein YecE (DUF72 family)
MEFGRVPEKQLNNIDFSLPKDPSFNKIVLPGTPPKDQRVYVGCAKWGRPEWVGKIYPPRTKEKDFLKFYVDQYNSIELNAVHHKLYGSLAIKKWADQAKNRDFRFCPKMYKGVTHSKGKLGTKTFLSNEFLRSVRSFGDKLGPIFIQANETFSPARKIELFDYLHSLPKDLRFFLEVRHPKWISEKEMQVELFEFLREAGIGAVITDTAGRRDLLHMHLSIPIAFIRFTGNSLHPTDKIRIDEWVKRIRAWLNKGLQEIYFFMHMHDEATSPELTVYLIEKLNKVCGLKLKPPEFVNEEYLENLFIS